MPSYYQEHKERLKDQQRQYYWEHGGKEQHRLNQHRLYTRIKDEVLEHYSNSSSPHCALCGVVDLDILCIDHINGGGNQHRRTLGYMGRGVHFYKWLKKQSFPEGYRVLCFNCNQKEAMRRQRLVGLKTMGITSGLNVSALGR